MKRKILIATTTRADWGLLSPLARELGSRDDCEVKIMASNMHLDPRRGNTIDEILADGFQPIVAPMDPCAPAPTALGQIIQVSAEVMEIVKPDILVALGDRFEMLGIVSAAALLRIPVVHIAGGIVTVGAMDDGFRHAITKLSAMHLTETERYRQRVIQLGEEPERVINTGAIGVLSAGGKAPMSREELEKDLDWEFGDKALLVTIHPETLSPLPAAKLAEETLKAIDRFPDSQLLITYPNNDPEGDVIIRAIEEFAAGRPNVKLVPSLGRKRYHSALHCVKAVVGNSSSGIVEVPSWKIPTVNIGLRQEGRIAAESVINCPAEAGAIADAIEKALKMDCSGVQNPYSQPDTLRKMADAIALTPLEELRKPKRFYDL